MLFPHIKLVLQKASLWKDVSIDLGIGTICARAIELLHIASVTPKKKKRRIGQLALTPVLSIIREGKGLQLAH